MNIKICGYVRAFVLYNSFRKLKIMSKRNADSVENVSNKKTKTGHWSLGLLEAVEDPELFIKSDNLVNVIKDKYPKSQFHYLIISKKDITSLNKVAEKDLGLLKHMDEVAREMLKDAKHAKSNFKIGYHAEPSMSRLHLHIISDDMNSPCIKTKKHWNSFTTDFFIPSEIVIQSLEENGNVLLPSKEECKKFMELPLKCHKCDYIPKHMPDLKKHILSHL